MGDNLLAWGGGDTAELHPTGRNNRMLSEEAGSGGAIHGMVELLEHVHDERLFAVGTCCTTHQQPSVYVKVLKPGCSLSIARSVG